MKETKKKWICVIVTIMITVGVLWAVNYIAVTYCIGNLKMFTALVLVVPVICVAAEAFFIGYQTEWNWKKTICVSLVLTMLSAGMSQFAVFMAGDKLDYIGSGELQENTADSSEDELMQELYAELDKMAYEYMLEQGLISEGEEIYAGEETMNGKATDHREEKDATAGDEIVSSEMYVGIQKSDPVTELIGNVMTFLVAFGSGMAGNKMAGKRKTKSKI